MKEMKEMTLFEIRALAVWGRARYLSVTEGPHNTEFHTWMGKKHFCFFETAEIGNRTPNSSVKGSGANHYPRAPALGWRRLAFVLFLSSFFIDDTLLLLIQDGRQISCECVSSETVIAINIW